jgi:putative flippase GtrA
MSQSPLQVALGKVRKHGLKYSAVSVINVVLGQSLLFGFHTIAEIEATTSNVLAVCISAGPAYYLSRAWVWGKRGKSHLTKEILPFWGFALAGLLLSTVGVNWASEASGAAAALDRGVDLTLWQKVVPNLANLVAFGIIWVVKFFVLDAVIFGPHQHHPVLDAEEDGAADGSPVAYDEPAREANTA